MSQAPQVLVIGAQKCGTTTLYEDLRAHPQIRLLDKERSALRHAPDRGSYQALFRGTEPVQGEVSTEYSMRPEIDVVERAQTWAPDARIVYIVREPISRVISHHHHDYALGLVDHDIDRAVRQHAPLVQNSRYASQIRPWLEAFGRDRVQVIRFENYMSARDLECGRLCSFLGLEPHEFDSTLIANAARTKVVATGRWNQLSRNRGYRALVRPFMSEAVRRRLMARVLPQAPERPKAPSRETVEHLIALLQPEVDELARLLGLSRWWDLNAAARAITRPA